MPLIDKPLHELRTYMGTNPMPSDFDAFWDSSLAEMHALNPDVYVAESSFKAPGAVCCDLYFTGMYGSRIYAKYLRPKNYNGKLPAIIQFHGYRGNSGEWWDKLAWVNAGFAVFSMDCRGQGGKSQDLTPVHGTTMYGQIIKGLSDSPQKLLFRQIFLDAAQLARIARSFDEIDENRLAAVGISQGGGITVACAALEPSIKLAVPMYPFLSDYKRVWEMDLCKDAYDDLRMYFRYFDPCHEREDDIFYRLGYIDIQNLAKRVKAKVLWGTGLSDPICPPSTQFAAYNKLKCEKEMKIYPDFAHELLPGFWDNAHTFIYNNL